MSLYVFGVDSGTQTVKVIVVEVDSGRQARFNSLWRTLVPEFRAASSGGLR
ncbi:MAG: hypothetical protein NTW38_03130 [Candidatus Aminicenantes bacterium]|nr:hypothetical protein [Candidatus Aminicenantes bacterium]